MKWFLIFSLFVSQVTYASSRHFCRSLEVSDNDQEKHTLSLCAETRFDGSNYVDILTNVTINGLPIQTGSRSRDLLSRICGVMHNRADDLASSRTERVHSQAAKLDLKGFQEIEYDIEEARPNKSLKTIRAIECQSLEFYMSF